ncbi:MAG: S1C family serine protease [Negativicutes bacterium]|nr:S1C family serine protease [Negativicutes bacterium]
MAILKVERLNTPPLALAVNTDGVQEGTQVWFIGAPQGLERTVTAGTVGSRAREIDGQRYIQLGATVTPGDSGGPLLDEHGLVLGLVTGRMEEAQGIGFVVPADVIQTFLNENGVSFVPGTVEGNQLAWRERTADGGKPAEQAVN